MSNIKNSLNALASGSRPRLGVREFNAVKGTVQMIFLLSAACGVTFAALGLYLLGGGDNSISFIGFELKTASFGVACVALGALTVIHSVRQLSNILKTAISH